jgi:predicted RNA-binding Zn-ribbon protein involved in translation (DUF1610 family)
MDEELRLLRKRVSELDDETLLRMVGEEASDYRSETVQIAMEEVRRRSLQISLVKPNAVGSKVATVEPATPCPACGSPRKRGTLWGESEVLAAFEAGAERRFVDIVACPSCGKAEITVDFKTEAEE